MCIMEKTWSKTEDIFFSLESAKNARQEGQGRGIFDFLGVSG